MASVLHDEILEQPEVIARLVETESAQIEELGAQIARKNPHFVLMAARGTSDNAARYAQYVFGARNGLTVALATPSLFSVYRRPPRLDGALVIGISQSGQSPDIVAVLEEAQRQGAPTVAITNDAQSPLAAAARYVIPLHAGVERSVAATKTYTASLAALALLSLGITPSEQNAAALRAMPRAMQRALESESRAQAAAGQMAHDDRAVAVGRGFNYATTFEVALKMKELSYLATEPYSSADFKHGPIALVEPGFPVVLIAVGATTRGEIVELGERLRGRGATLIALADTESAPAPSDVWLPVPTGLPEWLTPLPATLPGQLLAYHLALARGFNPDEPRAIRKVTLTR